MRACAKSPSDRAVGLTPVPKGAAGEIRWSSYLPAFFAAISVAFVVAMAHAGYAAAEHPRAYTGISFGTDGTGGSEAFSDVQSVAVDQTSGDVFVYDIAESFGAKGELFKFSAEGAPIDFAASGDNSIAIPGGSTEPGAEEIAIAPAGSPGGTAGDIYVANNSTVSVYSPAGTKLGSLGEEETCGVAVNPAGRIFVGSFEETIREYTPINSTTYNKTGEGKVSIELCNVAADGAANVYASNYAGGKTAKLKGIKDTKPILIEPGGATLAADPLTNELFLDRGDHISIYDSAAAPSYEIGAGELSESFGVAVRASTEWVYASDQESGTVKVFVPRYPTTEPATKVRAETAILHGTVRPEGRPYTDCRFEYGLASVAGFEKSSSCEPKASEIPAESPSFAVSRSLKDLQPNSDYKFRLVVTSSAGTIDGGTLTFSTVGPPRLSEIVARDAEQESATLEATVDPRGADTTYRIEWGSTDAYGNLAGIGSVSANEGPQAVSARIAGLSRATTYHYRIVAESTEGGEVASPDQLVETLNSCGFTDLRCLELVSPVDKGPIANPGRNPVGVTIGFQAAADGSAVAYPVEFGYPDDTAGNIAVLYLSRRGPAGWTSEQLSPPTLNPTAPASSFKVLSSGLACGIVASPSPLVHGAPETTVENDGENLYRRDSATGSYQLITELPPVDPPSREEVENGVNIPGYVVVGMSSDCQRVIFRAKYRYPGISASTGQWQLYEWDHGTLRDLAIIPGLGGNTEPVTAESLPGALDADPGSGAIGEKNLTDYWRSVSAGADHTVFTAVSRFGGDIGKRAIFLRDAADSAVQSGAVPATDISQSETATSNDGNSRYWTSSTDGSHVFFTARYGLAAGGSSTGTTNCANAPFSGVAEGSGEGCDLYEYNADAPAGSHLTDLSPDLSDRKGASVAGVLDASEDGTYVYFAALGRLGGAGKTESENIKSATYNIYMAYAGAIYFVHSIGQDEAIGSVGSASALITTVDGERRWTSRTEADGRRFVFESSYGVPGNVRMVYLYSASDGTTVCVSCRRDGLAPFSEQSLTPLISARETNTKSIITQPTVLTENGRLYFYSFDPLAKGAVEGARNLYQWEHGQVSLITSEPLGTPRSGGNPFESFFGGASADGEDVYFATTQSLTGGARDGWNVYDARVGGGLPEPESPAAPCDAATEGACNSGGATTTPGESPPTATFGGPGNPPTKHRRNKHKKPHKRRHHKRHRHSHGSRGGKSQRSESDRGVSR